MKTFQRIENIFEVFSERNFKLITNFYSINKENNLYFFFTIRFNSKSGKVQNVQLFQYFNTFNFISHLFYILI